MAQHKDTTDIQELLFRFMGTDDPMLNMLEWLCGRMMEAEVSCKLGAEKHEQSQERTGYRCGFRTRRLDTRLGTMYLLVPKVRNGGYIPFFVTERKRSEAALIQAVQEAFVQGVSTRKMERLAKSLGIEGISRSQVSEMAKGLNEQVEEFRNRPLTARAYPVLWVDALYEKVRYGGRVVSMAILLVCGVNEEGKREVLAIEPMLEESRESYGQLFEKLKERGLTRPSLIVSDAHKGLVSAIGECFPGAAWQRCKVHFMRNILAHVPQKEKERFAGLLKSIWMTTEPETARQRAQELADGYRKKYPKAIEILEDGLEDSLTFLSFPSLDARKVSSNNMLERLNKEIRRRTRVVGIFPNPESHLRLVTVYLIEYSEDWSITRSYLSEESLKSIDKLAA
ncbi:MAG TPA: IS256 family transposase [Clostridiales bacterium]|nr:MAG: Transposase, Mutator family [Firmicutes bacterium ADurb.Bin262]HOU10955.1 IS256 family transposase [Clostridiales bacterium]